MKSAYLFCPFCKSYKTTWFIPFSSVLKCNDCGSTFGEAASIDAYWRATSLIARRLAAERGEEYYLLPRLSEAR